MKKTNLWMLLVILFISLNWSACQKEDNPSSPVTPSKTGFFTTEVNALIDANYPEAKSKGYARLEIPASLIPKNFIQISAGDTWSKDQLIKNGKTVYVNGGTVRDAVVGIAAHDVDFSAGCTLDELVAIYGDKCVKFDPSPSFCMVKVYHSADEEPTDVSPIMTIEAYHGENMGKHGIPTTKYPGQRFCNDLLEDTYTRDFTINALYYDLANGSVIDYHGGLHDIREGIINTIFDADYKFSSDPRAIPRAIRFKVKLNFKYDDALLAALNSSQMPEWLAKLDPYNVVYNLESGWNGGFSLKFFQELQNFKITDYFMASLKDVLHTDSYQKQVETILGAYDKAGKTTMTACYAAIFWPAIASALSSVAAPTKDQIVAEWKKLDAANSKNFDFSKTKNDTYDATMVPANMQQIWYLQYLMADSANQTSEKAATIVKMEQFDLALKLFKARAAYDSTLAAAADFWTNAAK